MNICIVTNGYPANKSDYVAAFARNFSLALKRQGHGVYIFTPDRKVEKQTDFEIRVKWFKWWGGDRPLIKLNPFSPFDALKILSLLWSGQRGAVEYVKKNNIDFILALWALPSGFFAYKVKKKLGIPYGVWVLGSDVWIYSKMPVAGKIMARVLLKADVLFADGVKLARDTENISGKKCYFMPTSRLLPQQKNIKKTEGDRKKKNFLFIGRLEIVKGVDIFIDAVKILVKQDKISNAVFNILGVGAEENNLKNKVKEYGLKDYVFFRGYASAEDVAFYLDNSDWLVIPSRNESIPVVFSDALQRDVPVIVTGVGDLGNLVKLNRIGIVVPPNDVIALEKVLKAIAEGDIDSLDYKRNIKSVWKKFDVNEAAKDFIKKVKNLKNG